METRLLIAYGLILAMALLAAAIVDIGFITRGGARIGGVFGRRTV